MQKIKPSYFFWTALIVGCVIRFWVIFQSQETLLTRWGSDDLFYYSQIAGHVAEGHGFTFDGIHPTNGFQPLFLFILVPFGSLLLNDWYLSWVLVSLLVTFFSVLTCFQLRSFIKELGGSKDFSSWLPVVFILHPVIITVTFNGTEAALSFFMVVLSLRAFLWLQKGEKIISAAVIFSLLVLTRMEYSIFLFLLFLFAMLQNHSLKKWMIVAVGPILTFGAWLVMNYVYFGAIIPSSGQAKSIHGGYYMFSFFDGFVAAHGTVLHAEAEVSYVIVLLLLVGFYFLLRNRSLVRWLGFLLVSSVVLLSLSLWQMKGFRDWYLIPQFLIILICVSYAIVWLMKGFKKFAPILLLVPVILWYEAQNAQRHFTGHQVLLATKGIDLPPGVSIGSFNAGLPSAILGERYTIVNLDGVVNNSVLEFQQSQELECYLQQENISYVFDYLPSQRFFLNTFGTNISRETVFCDCEKADSWCLEKLSFN